MFNFARQRNARVHPVDALPPLRLLVPLGLQHVLIAYSGMVTCPLLIGLGIGLPQQQIATLITANVFIGGVATLLQTLGIFNIGARLPLIMGSTFTGITPAIIVGKQGGLPAVFGATIVAGLLAWLAAPYFSKLLRFFPPLVTGTIIAIIGFSLLPSTSNLIAGSDPTAAGYASPKRLLLAGLTIAIVLVIERLAPPALRRIGILTGLVLGTLLAFPLGMTDFSTVAGANAFGIVKPFTFGVPTFALAAIVPMLVVQAVNMVETTGHVLAVGDITGKEVDERTIGRALRADGASSAMAGVFNTFPIVTFSNNVGVVSITQVFSRFVVAMAGVFLVMMGLLPKLGAVIAALPGPVLGGVTVIMFGTVGVVGLKIAAQADLSNPRNVMVVAVAFGFGMMPTGAPQIYHNLPQSVQTVLGSGIAAGGICAIVLNWILNRNGAQHRASPSGGATGVAPLDPGNPARRDDEVDTSVNAP